MLGKTVDELQSNIQVGENEITGTLNYVTGYTGFSGDISKQSGHYLALHTESNADTVTVEVVGGTGPVEIDSDGISIGYISENTAVKFVATLGDETLTKQFALNLTLAEE